MVSRQVEPPFPHLKPTVRCERGYTSRVAPCHCFCHHPLRVTTSAFPHRGVWLSVGTWLGLLCQGPSQWHQSFPVHLKHEFSTEFVTPVACSSSIPSRASDSCFFLLGLLSSTLFFRIRIRISFALASLWFICLCVLSSVNETRQWSQGIPGSLLYALSSENPFHFRRCPLCRVPLGSLNSFHHTLSSLLLPACPSTFIWFSFPHSANLLV